MMKASDEPEWDDDEFGDGNDPLSDGDDPEWIAMTEWFRN